MKLVLVLHEASQTGAPRIGGLIAAALKKYMDVQVVCLHDGPLVPWLREVVGSANVRLMELGGGQRCKAPFAERAELAREAIEQINPDVVYVNSVAASEFVVGSREADRPTVLHVHEKADMLRWLLRDNLTKLEVIRHCDAIVLAAGDLRKDIIEVFGEVPHQCLDFGIVVDPQSIHALANEDDVQAYNAAGEPLLQGSNLVVGMCGHASIRKGADVFFEVAEALPSVDHLWVGNWDADVAPENPIYDRYVERQLPNFYTTGAVTNPYKYMKRLDLFFLSSREDPNPVVLAEALTLDIPILAFSQTTAVTDFLGRSSILCHGQANVADAQRVISALDPNEMRSEAFRASSRRYGERFDIAKRVPKLLELFESLQLAAPAMSEARAEEAGIPGGP